MKALYHLMSTVSADTVALHQCNIRYVRHLAEKTVNSRIASIYYYNLRIAAENVLTLDSLVLQKFGKNKPSAEVDDNFEKRQTTPRPAQQQ